MNLKMNEKDMNKLIKKLKLKNVNLEKQIEREVKVNLYERMGLRKELVRLRSIISRLQVSAENLTQRKIENVVDVQHTDSSFWEKLNKIQSRIDLIDPTVIQYETSGLDESSIEKIISWQPAQKYGIPPALDGCENNEDNPQVYSDDDTYTALEDNAFPITVETDGTIQEKEKEAIDIRDDDRKESKCSECGNDTSWESFITLHRTAYKDGVKIPPCFTCNKSFLQSGHFDGKHRLKRPPKQTSKIKRCICETCGSQFTSRGSLLQHYATHRPAQYTCDICSYKCRRKTYLKKHIETHKKRTATEDTPITELPSYTNATQPEYECKICSHVAHTKSSLNLHHKSHTTKPAINGGNAVQNVNDKKCNVCSYSCSSLSRLKSHLQTHYGIKPFSCEFCEYKATTKYNLSVHRKLHLDDKQYRCDICKYSCVTAAKLNIHLKRHK